MLEALRRFWRGSDLPRGAGGHVRDPLDVRDGGMGARPLPSRPEPAAPGARNEPWGSRLEIAIGSASMTHKHFESMSHAERLRWYHATRMVTARPDHHAVLEWWGK